MSKANDLSNEKVALEDVAGVVYDLFSDASTVVNGKTKKAKFDKKTGSVDSASLAETVQIAETNGVYYALGTADVKAYYYNSNLSFTVASSIAAGVFNNYGQAVDSMTFARGAATTKVYAYGKDVTLFDTTAGDIFVGGFNPYDKKNANAALERVTGDVTVDVFNSTATNIYAGGEGDSSYQGDVVINVYNSKVGKIYAGGKNGAYTEGDVTVVVSNNGNKNANGTNMVFTGAVFGTAADKNSMSWGTTNVVISDYKGAYNGAFNYVDTVVVAGDSAVTLNGAMKEVGTVAVAGAASATVNKAGAYAYELVLNSETLANSSTAMLTLGKSVKSVNKLVVTVADDYAMNGSVNLASWAGYTPKKGEAAITPDFAVMNGNGGIVADYMYDYSFDANNNLVFNYTGEAYVLQQTVTDPVYTENGALYIPGVAFSEQKTFGAADDKVVVANNYDYTLFDIDLGAGTNEIDITNADAARYGAFELKVSKASANTVDARGFANDVAFLDNGNGENTVIVDNNTGSVDFKNSNDATLVVNGVPYNGNVDFSSVSEDAVVVLENGAKMGIGQIDAGDKDVNIEVGAFNEVTLRGLNVERYVLGVNDENDATDDNYRDINLELGNNAVINTNDAKTSKVVQDYSKNIYADTAVTYDVLGNMSSKVIVKNTTLTINNYGNVSGRIVADDTAADLNLNNYGRFNGVIDFADSDSQLVIDNKTLENTGLAVEFGGSVNLGDATDNAAAGVDAYQLNFDGDAKFSANITKIAAANSTLAINIQNGTTDFSGNISYTMKGDHTDEYVPADKDATDLGIANTTLTITDATLKIAEGSKLDVNTVTINNAVINGAFDAGTVQILGGDVVFGSDETFRGNFTLANGASLTAKNLTVEGTINITGDVTATSLTAGASVIIAGSANITGDVKANAGSVSLTATTVDDTIFVGGSVTAVAAKDENGNYVTTSGNVRLGGAGSITVGDITASVLEDADGNYLGGGNVFLNAAEITTGAVNAAFIDASNGNDNAKITFGGAVDALMLQFKEGKTVTFNDNATLRGIWVNDNGGEDFAVINVAEGKSVTATTMMYLNDNAKLALNLNGTTFTVTGMKEQDAYGSWVDSDYSTLLGTNSEISIANGSFVGGIAEADYAWGATVTLKDATVDKVKFTGSTINVENAGTIGELTATNGLTISGVESAENDAADKLTITKLNAVNQNLTISDIEIVGDINLDNVETKNVIEGSVTLADGDVTLGNVTAGSISDDYGVGKVTIGNIVADSVVLNESQDVTIESVNCNIAIGGKNEDVIVDGWNVDADKDGNPDKVADKFTIGTAKGDVTDLYGDVEELNITNANGRVEATAAALTIVKWDDRVVDEIKEDGTVVYRKDVFDTISAKSVNITGQEADINGNITANGDLTITAKEGTVINGTLNVTEGNLTVNGAKVAGDVNFTNNETWKDGKVVTEDALNVKFDLVDNYEGTITINSYQGTTTKLDLGGYVDNLKDIVINGAGKVEFAEGSGVGSAVVVDKDGNIDGNKEVTPTIDTTYNGDIVGNVQTAANIIVKGSVFATAGKDIAAADVTAGSFTVDAENIENEAVAKFVDEALAAKYDVNEDNVAAKEVKDTVLANYADGFVNAKVTADNVSIDKFFIGSVKSDFKKEKAEDADAVITFGKDATAAMDTIKEVASGKDMDDAAKKAPTVADLVTATDEVDVVAKGDVYGNVDYYVNEDYLPEIKNRKYVAVTNGVNVKADDVTVEGDFFGNIEATGDVVTKGDVALGKVEVAVSETATPVDDKFTKGEVKAETFVNENADANIYADITASGYDVKNEKDENVATTDVVIKAAATVNGNVTATKGSVALAGVKGNVDAKANATITGDVEGTVKAGADIKIEGNVTKSVTSTDGNIVMTGNVVEVEEKDGKVVKTTYGDVEATKGSVELTGSADEVTAAKGITVDGDARIVKSTVEGDVKVTGNVDEATAFKGNVEVEGNVKEYISGANVTVGGTVGVKEVKADKDKGIEAVEGVEGEVKAEGTATLGGNVYGIVTADKVVGSSDVTEVTGVVTASSIDLADATVGGITAEKATEVTVAGVTGDVYIEAAAKAELNLGKIDNDKAEVTIETAEDAREDFTVNATFGDVKVSSITLTGASYEYGKGEEEQKTVNGAINVEADTILAATLAVAGTVTIDADVIAATKKEETVKDAEGKETTKVTYTGIDIEGKGSLTLNADTYAKTVDVDNLTVNKLLSGAEVEADTLTIGEDAKFMEAELDAATIVFEAGDVKLSDYFGADTKTTFAAGKLVADTLTIDQALTLGKNVEVTGDLTVTSEKELATKGITLLKDGAVFDGAVKVGGGITFDTNGEVVQIERTSVTGSDKANTITFEAKSGEGVKMYTGTINLLDGDDKLIIESALDTTASSNGIDGGKGKDTIELNAALKTAKLSGIEEVIFGDAGTLDITGTFSLTKDTKFFFDEVGKEGAAVVTGLDSVTNGAVINVDDVDWTWNAKANAFYAADAKAGATVDALKYDKEKDTLAWGTVTIEAIEA